MQLAQRRAHRAIWVALGILLPVLFVMALVMRPEVPVEAEAVERLAPPPLPEAGGSS